MAKKVTRRPAPSLPSFQLQRFPSEQGNYYGTTPRVPGTPNTLQMGWMDVEGSKFSPAESTGYRGGLLTMPGEQPLPDSKVTLDALAKTLDAPADTQAGGSSLNKYGALAALPAVGMGLYQGFRQLNEAKRLEGSPLQPYIPPAFQQRKATRAMQMASGRMPGQQYAEGQIAQGAADAFQANAQAAGSAADLQQGIGRIDGQTRTQRAGLGREVGSYQRGLQAEAQQDALLESNMQRDAYMRRNAAINSLKRGGRQSLFNVASTVGQIGLTAGGFALGGPIGAQAAGMLGQQAFNAFQPQQPAMTQFPDPYSF